MGWTMDDVQDMQRVSDGLALPQAVVRQPGEWITDPLLRKRSIDAYRTTLRLFDIVRDSRAHIGMLDFAAWDLLRLPQKDYSTPKILSSARNPDAVIQEERGLIAAHAADVLARENHIVTQLVSTIAVALYQKPELLQAEELRVTLSLGSFHTRVFELLKAAGFSVQRYDQAPLRPERHECVAMRSVMQGDSPSESFLMRSRLAFIFSIAFSNHFLDVALERVSDVGIKVADSLSDQELRALYDVSFARFALHLLGNRLSRRGNTRDSTAFIFRRRLLALCSAKNIDVPRLLREEALALS